MAKLTKAMRGSDLMPQGDPAMHRASTRAKQRRKELSDAVDAFENARLYGSLQQAVEHAVFLSDAASALLSEE